MSRYCLLAALQFLILGFLATGCDSDSTEIIVPEEEGYDWPSSERDYWPTDQWRTAPLEHYGIDPAKMQRAEDFAEADELSRALVVVRGGRPGSPGSRKQARRHAPVRARGSGGGTSVIGNRTA